MIATARSAAPARRRRWWCILNAAIADRPLRRSTKLWSAVNSMSRSKSLRRSWRDSAAKLASLAAFAASAQRVPLRDRLADVVDDVALLVATASAPRRRRGRRRNSWRAAACRASMAVVLRRRREFAAEQFFFHLGEGLAGRAGVIDRHQRPVIGVGDDVAGGRQHIDAIAAERADHQRHGDEGAEDLDADLEAGFA